MRARQDKASEGKFSGLSTILLAMAAIALAGMVGTIGLIRQVGDIGPNVGDIVALDSMSRNMKASVTAVHTGTQHGVACVLDVRAMHAGGGSLVIESRQPATTN